MDAEMVAVCSPSLKAKSAIKKPADVAKFPLLHQMARPNRWAEWMADAGVPHDRPLLGHTYQLAMLSQAAVAGLGIALLPLISLNKKSRTESWRSSAVISSRR